ncbi:unnamed protein product [Allacma fusca]|uniref:Uncharacterized protein n=1 Tax=Allacma fusca TaxID=39272 RepID=A0A8J2LMY1_9HEXA|nr:unnamed protein product [Allacma fusca]
MAKLYWRKQDITDNLLMRGIPVPQGKCTKKDLIDISEKFPVLTKYIIEDMAEKSGKDITVLWLPVAHCELNSIELIWSWVKQKVGKLNSHGGISKVLQVKQDVISTVTPELWKSCVNHVKKVEEDMWQRDNLYPTNFVDRFQEPIIISLRGEDSSSDEDSDSEVGDAAEAYE